MRILCLTHNFPYPPEKDGQTLIAYYLLKQLASRHQITLFSFSDQSDCVNEHRFTDLGIAVRLFRRPQRRLWAYYLSRWPRRLAWFQYRLFDPAMLAAITEADHNGAYDIIYIHAPGVSGYINQITQTPVVYASIDAMSAWFDQFNQAESNLLKRYHYARERDRSIRMEKETLPRVAAVTVVSDVDRDLIANHSPGSRIVTIPNGVDLDFFRPSNTPADTNLIAFSGTMNYPANVRAVLDFNKDTWPQLKKANPDLHWLIVGKNPTLEIFELQSTDRRITVTGYIKDVRTFLWRSAVYVSPLQFGTGFKNKIIEAMACGKAVVASPISLSGFPVTDGVNVMVARTPDEFYAKTLQLMHDVNLRHNLEIAARSFAERYSWSRTANAYEQLFQQVIVARHSSR
ncbi:MAG: glycosyltransferase [Patescibacteria group bacterium]|jgi:glycosyltransferase involved in cell wall biosynthesis